MAFLIQYKGGVGVFFDTAIALYLILTKSPGVQALHNIIPVCACLLLAESRHLIFYVNWT